MKYFILVSLAVIWFTAYLIPNGWFIQALVVLAVFEMILGATRKE